MIKFWEILRRRDAVHQAAQAELTRSRSSLAHAREARGVVDALADKLYGHLRDNHFADKLAAAYRGELQ